MSDRDQFAAAALTGLLGGRLGPYSGSENVSYAKLAHSLADAMLRERDSRPAKPDSSTNHDAAPAAWAVMERDGFGIEGTFTNRDEAAEWCDNRQEIVPLYRSPTLTDAERGAIQEVIDYLQPAWQRHQNHVAATLRGLLKRLGGER